MLQSSLFGNRDRSNRPERKLSDFLGRGSNAAHQQQQQSYQQQQQLGSNLPSLQGGTPPTSASQGSRLLKAKEAAEAATPREPEACFCTVQGKRPYQEDQYAICPFLQDANNPGVPETHFYGVFDGHAGGRCSKAIATAIPINLAKDDAYKTKLIQAIKRTISRTNDQFLEIAERMRLNDGSTGVFCVLRDGKLVVANVGDSRAIMISNGKSVALTKDHKPSSPEEQRRIASFGGVITNNTGIPRVQGVLAVSRAYGNCSIRQYIRADPDIITRDLTPDDDFIVIASDGLWDVYRNSEVAEIVYAMDQQGCKLQRVADHLVQNSLLKGSMDNVTCVIVRISNYAARATNDSLPAHLQQQVDINSGGSRRGGRGIATQKYDSKVWGNVSTDEDDLDGGGLNGVSVYYPPSGVAAGTGGSGGRAVASAQEEEGKKQSAGSKQLNRSRSSNRLKGSSKRVPLDPYGTEEAGDGSSYSRRGSKTQNTNLNVTITGGDSAENGNGSSRAGRDSSQHGQSAYPSSAYRPMHRPYTQASASAAASGQLEAVGKTPSAQKALFVPSAYAQVTQGGGDSGNDAPSYSGGRSYALFGGNNMVPTRDGGSGYARPSTSSAEGSHYTGQRGYAAKRSDNYVNSRYMSDPNHRPNSAAPVLNQKQGPGSRYGASTLHHQEQAREFPPPHSPIVTMRNRK